MPRGNALHHDPIITGGTATLAGLWLVAPDFWAWLGSLFQEGSIIVPLLSALWLTVQIVNVVSGWIRKWRGRE